MPRNVFFRDKIITRGSCSDRRDLKRKVPTKECRFAKWKSSERSKRRPGRRGGCAGPADPPPLPLPPALPQHGSAGCPVAAALLPGPAPPGGGRRGLPVEQTPPTPSPGLPAGPDPPAGPSRALRRSRTHLTSSATCSSSSSESSSSLRRRKDFLAGMAPAAARRHTAAHPHPRNPTSVPRRVAMTSRPRDEAERHRPSASTAPGQDPPAPLRSRPSDRRHRLPPPLRRLRSDPLCARSGLRVVFTHQIPLSLAAFIAVPAEQPPPGAGVCQRRRRQKAPSAALPTRPGIEPVLSGRARLPHARCPTSSRCRTPRLAPRPRRRGAPP